MQSLAALLFSMGNSTEPFITSEITRIEVANLDCRVSSKFSNRKSQQQGGGARGEIRELSRQSRTRLIYKARNIPDLMHMATFTYPHADYAEEARGGDYMADGKAVKEHLRRIRQWFTYRKCYGFWFLEFQKRGAPHFHFIYSGTLTEKDHAKIKRSWAKLVGTSCEHHPEKGVKFEVLRKRHAAGAYAAKYSSKDEQKVVPEQYKGVGRFWGLFGDIPDSTHTVEITSLKEIYNIARFARRAQKAYTRAQGYRHKRNSKRHQSGVLYNTGRSVRAYVERLYIIPENPSRIDLLVREWHTSESLSPSSGDSAKANAPPF